MPKPDAAACPVADQAQQVAAIAKALAVAMRKLRRMTTRCARCEQNPPCTPMQNWINLINTAVQECNDEWNRSTTT